MEWLTSIFSGIGTEIIKKILGKRTDHADNITIEYAMVNIKVKGSRKQCEEGEATVTYLGSFLVNSPSKSIYQDFVEVAPESKIESVKFIPEAEIVDEDQIKRNPCIWKYELDVPNDGFICGEVIVKQALREKAGGIGFHTPLNYHTKELVFNIDLSEVDFICQYNIKAKLKRAKMVKKIKTIFFEDSNTYIFKLKNVPANSNIAFEWENDEV